MTVTPASVKTRTLGPVTITPRLAPATNFPGLKSADKDKAKTESKGDGKTDRVESEDGQSSNSSLDIPSSSGKGKDSALPKADEKGEKLVPKDDLQGTDQDSSFSKNTASDLTKNFNDGSAENKTSDVFSDKQGSARHLDHMLNKATDLSSSLNAGSSSFSGNMYNADKGSSQSSSLPFPGNFSSSSSSSGSKQYNSTLHSGSMMAPSNFSKPTDLSVDDKASSTIENQWKSPSAPQPFSPGVPAPSSKSTSQQRSLESPAFDDNSSNSIHSNLSGKSSSAHGANLESRAPPSVESGHSSYVGTDLSTSHSKTSNKHSSSSVTSSQSSSSSKLNSSSSVPTTTSSNFPPLDPYANLYGSYGAYPGGLPTSNYYNPYGYPPGFLPDPKSTLSSKNSTEPISSTSVPPSRSSSKSSSSRSDSKKPAHESSRSSLPAAYESRQPSSSSSSSTNHGSRSSASSASASAASSGSGSGSSTAAPDTGAYSSSSSAAAAAAAYNPMMMSPSFNPTSCQYPPPSSAAGSANPFTAAAAAAANYTNPYAASPYGYPPNQFDAAMYSAFHRPEAGLDPTSPYLRPMAGAAAGAAGGFYPQNVYGSQYGSARDPYGQIPPYPASPFIMPPAPYGGLSSSATAASSTTTSDQSPSQ